MKLSRLLTIALCLAAVAVFSCNEGVKKDQPTVDVQDLTKDKPETHGTLITASDITLSTPLNAEWVTSGKGIYDLKCQSCHKLTGEKLVGPGWADVTKRRKPEWIMNMITNVETMLAEDPEAQKLLEQCMVRMPNQNLTKDEARTVVEYMRSNDGEK
ncbi:MAG TPA: cytochrome c [Chitinophagaceae bacterium]|jgi:mono/diheme cytochrome c family protein|nr:cytochrome c [Chitinophagaceae bacterium]